MTPTVVRNHSMKIGNQANVVDVTLAYAVSATVGTIVFLVTT